TLFPYTTLFRSPEEIHTEPFSIKRLYKISPLSVIGTFANGIASSAFWAFGALYILKAGFGAHNSALFIAFTFTGALILQWPLGFISDIFSRKIAIILCSLMSALTSLLILALTDLSYVSFNDWFLFSAFLLGGFSYPIYSLFISLANDFLKPGMFVKASAALLAINGIGSILGPLLAASFIHIFEKEGSFYFLILMYGFICFATTYKKINPQKIPKYIARFIPLPKTTTSIYHLDPRFDDIKNKAAKSDKLG